MAPIRFTAQTSGTSTAGYFTFAGTASGAVVLPPGPATSGPWRQARPPSLRITVDIHLTSPLRYHLGPTDVTGLAGTAAAGGAVGKPELTTGTWTCSGDTLVSTPAAGAKVTGAWTLRRTGPG